MNDPIVDGRVGARAYVGDAGEMHHALDALDNRRPIERLHIVRDGDNFDAARERRRRGGTRRGAYRNTRRYQRPHQGMADESRRTGDEDAPAHRRLAKSIISHPTRHAPASSASAADTGASATTLKAASATSAALIAKTRPTICSVLRPLSRAR